MCHKPAKNLLTSKTRQIDFQDLLQNIYLTTLYENKPLFSDMKILDIFSMYSFQVGFFDVLLSKWSITAFLPTDLSNRQSNPQLLNHHKSFIWNPIDLIIADLISKCFLYFFKVFKHGTPYQYVYKRSCKFPVFPTNNEIIPNR